MRKTIRIDQTVGVWPKQTIGKRLLKKSKNKIVRDLRLDSMLIRNSKVNFYEENGAEVYELEVNIPKKYFNGDGTWSDGF